jgi:hypothetical protein
MLYLDCRFTLKLNITVTITPTKDGTIGDKKNSLDGLN